MTSKFPGRTSSSIFLLFFFFVFFLFLLLSLVTGPSFISISLLVLKLWQFYFMRNWPNLEIGDTPTWVLPNIWWLGQGRDTKFGTNVSNKMLRNSAKCQGYSLYHFWVIKWKPTIGGGRVKLPPPPPTQIRVKTFLWNLFTKTIFINWRGLPFIPLQLIW